MPAKRVPKKIEYVNATKGVILYVDVTTPYDEKPVPQRVNPGESVFLTPEDVERNTHQSRQIFVLGHLRPASVGEKNITKIEVRDSMSQLEIETFVQKADELEQFENDISTLISKNTLREILDNCKKENKSWNFISSVEERIKAIDEEEKKKIG